MSIFDLFSKRQKAARGELPDVYVYDEFPDKLRVQVIHILGDAIGRAAPYDDRVPAVWRAIHDALAREYGVFKFGDSQDPGINVSNYFLGTDDHEKAADFIELSFKIVDTHCRKQEYQWNVRPKATPDEAIEELNARLREHGVGYAFESGRLVRIDSQLVHSEVVKPTLSLLRSKHFAGANTEYLNAFDHYKEGRFEECLTECLKAFESTMKAICHKRGWAFAQTDTARRLIEICLANKLIPDYLQSELSALRSTLESGVPTVRNKEGGHGRGVEPRSVPRHLAAYLLHLTATSILLLAESDTALK